MIARAMWAEAIGSFLLFACVIGSGVMGDRLSGPETRKICWLYEERGSGAVEEDEE